jgi:hypothetical protein
VIPPPPDTPSAASRPKSGLSRRVRTTITTFVISAIVLIAIIGYGVIGLTYAATRITGADRTLNTVVSHQNNVNSTFTEIDTSFSTLNTSTAFDPLKARALADEFVAHSKTAGTTVEQDDASLAVARSSLNENMWLTLISKGNLDKEATRIAHARKALSHAGTVFADYLLVGQFWQVYFDMITDLDKIAAQDASGDFAGAKTTAATMKTHADQALNLSNAPGFPTDVHDMMGDYETLIADLVKYLDALESGDPDAIHSATSGVSADVNRVSAYKTDKIASAMAAFYKPMIDGFNNEMAAATT